MNYTYTFKVWILCPTTLVRTKMKKIVIYASNCVSAVRELQKTHSLDLVHNGRNMELDITFNVEADSNNGLVFTEYQKGKVRYKSTANL